jgi:transcriptional regulator with XRE-family HTH domain
MTRDSRRFGAAFARALKGLRNRRGLTQEDFSEVSSRTYVSTLERGLKSPTLEKINALCETLDCHPLSLLTLAYAEEKKGENYKQLLRRIEKELEGLE